MYSPEIFQAGGVTYFAVVMQDSANYLTATEGAIYALGLGADAGNRLARRIDNGTAANRFEPELLIGTSEVFVYFNVGGTLRRARSGIFLNPKSELTIEPATATTATLRTGLNQPGFTYQIETSTSLSGWTNFGSAFPGDGTAKTIPVSTGGEPRRFYRLRQTQDNP
jgi:hypothetical protein